MNSQPSAPFDSALAAADPEALARAIDPPRLPDDTEPAMALADSEPVQIPPPPAVPTVALDLPGAISEILGEVRGLRGEVADLLREVGEVRAVAEGARRAAERRADDRLELAALRDDVDSLECRQPRCPLGPKPPLALVSSAPGGE